MNGSGSDEVKQDYAVTPVSEISGIVDELRANFYETMPTSLEYRLQQLRQILKMITENKKEIFSAFTEIFGGFGEKHYITRLYLIEVDLVDMINNLESYMKETVACPQKFPINVMWSSEVRPHPKGVVCIIGAWNYPLSLVLRPLVGAIAAGNACVLKPSEVSDAIARVFVKLIPKYLDSKMVRVIAGGIPETTKLLEQKFDYICFTGSSFIGKIVMSAAAKHLTPVCLELGGKNPVIIDDNADLDTSMKRVAFARWWFNSGQVCVCPEYLLVSEDKVDKCIGFLRKYINQFFISKDSTIADSKHYGKIVNKGHWQRLNKIRRHYIDNESDKIVIGETCGKDKNFGESNIDARFMAPMVIRLTEDDFDSDKIMQNEVFGPFLTIIGMKNSNCNKWKARACDLIRSRGEPLVCYIYSSDNKFIDYFDARIAAGSITCNDCIMQMSLKETPFGGTGESGMGSYGGKHSFDTFSHMKPISKRSHGLEFLNKDRYPPGDLKGILKMMEKIKPREGPSTVQKCVKYGMIIVAAIFIGYMISVKMQKDAPK